MPISTPTSLRLPVAALLSATLALSGCVSSKYKLAKSTDIRPPIAINLASTQPPLETMVNTVIIYQGPGSWKREAYWDEYVLTFANRGDSPLTIDAISITGLARTATPSGTEPWSIEKESRTLQDQGFGLAKDTAVQIGGGIATIAAGAAAGAGTFGLVFGGLGAGVGVVGATILGAVALPAFIGGSIYANVSSRHEVEREFARRRLQLPVTLVAGQVAQGSLYFPITPGPRQLVLKGRAGKQPVEATLDLARLASLHLKPPPATPAGPQTTGLSTLPSAQ